MRISRNCTIDAMKGIAILLVVVGHALQVHTNDYDKNIIFRAIYSFHMPLFMFLSGFVAYGHIENKNLIKYAGNKFIKLVIPFISWYFIVSYLLAGGFHKASLWDYAIQIIKSPSAGGLWFLWVLFLNFISLCLAVKLTNYIKGASFPVIVLFVLIAPVKVLGFGLVKWYLPFFLGGYLIAKFKQILARYKTLILEASLLIYPLCLIFWSRTQEPGFIGFFHSWVPGQLSVILTGVVFLYKYITAFSGIAVIYVIIRRLDGSKVFQGLGALGLYTMDIYVLHWNLYFVAGLGFCEINTNDLLSSTAVIAFSTALMITLSICISKYLLMQSKVLRFLFLGGYKLGQSR